MATLTRLPKSFFLGLAVYALWLALGIILYESSEITAASFEWAAIAALGASVLVIAAVLSGLDLRIHDPDAVFLQSLFGVIVTTDMFRIFTTESEAILQIVPLMWVGIGLFQLASRRVLLLLVLYVGLFAFARREVLLDGTHALRDDTLFQLGLSGLFGLLIYLHSRLVNRLQSNQGIQARRLKEAEEQIYNFRVRDVQTKALKYPYFVGQLTREKVRVDQYGGTFSAGIVEIDGFNELMVRMGENTAAQLLREFAERTISKLRELDLLGVWDGQFEPLGRMAEGRFAVIFPMTEFDDAVAHAEGLRTAVEFQSIRTQAAILTVTLSIGVTEYMNGEPVDAMMGRAEQALKVAASHNGNSVHGIKTGLTGLNHRAS